MTQQPAVECSDSGWDRPATACQMVGFTDVVGGRWKLAILCALATNGSTRFNQLVAELEPITPTTLTRKLRELERDGLITRKQFNEIPPRVEYAATEAAITLKPVLRTIADWVEEHVGNIEAKTAS